MRYFAYIVKEKIGESFGIVWWIFIFMWSWLIRHFFSVSRLEMSLFAINTPLFLLFTEICIWIFSICQSTLNEKWHSMLTKLIIFVWVQDNAIMCLDNFNTTLNKENVIVLFWWMSKWPITYCWETRWSMKSREEIAPRIQI